jgi:hypothetical protein
MKESGIKREYCRSPVKPPSKNVWSKLEFHERAHFLRRHLTISNPAAHILARVRLTITDNEPSGRLMVRPGPLSDPSPLPGVATAVGKGPGIGQETGASHVLGAKGGSLSRTH